MGACVNPSMTGIDDDERALVRRGLFVRRHLRRLCSLWRRRRLALRGKRPVRRLDEIDNEARRHAVLRRHHFGFFHNRRTGQINDDARLARAEPAGPRSNDEPALSGRNLNFGLGQIDDDPIGVGNGENPVLRLFREEGYIPRVVSVAADFRLQRDFTGGGHTGQWQHQEQEDGRQCQFSGAAVFASHTLPFRPLRFGYSIMLGGVYLARCGSHSRPLRPPAKAGLHKLFFRYFTSE